MICLKKIKQEIQWILCCWNAILGKMKNKYKKNTSGRSLSFQNLVILGRRGENVWKTRKCAGHADGRNILKNFLLGRYYLFSHNFQGFLQFSIKSFLPRHEWMNVWVGIQFVEANKQANNKKRNKLSMRRKSLMSGQ